MSLFDRVWVKCPCGQSLAFQSKAGDCSLNDYELSNVPVKIAGDLIGESERCICGRLITMRGDVILIPEESM
jgi:hypothetical protein